MPCTGLALPDRFDFVVGATSESVVQMTACVGQLDTDGFSSPVFRNKAASMHLGHRRSGQRGYGRVNHRANRTRTAPKRQLKLRKSKLRWLHQNKRNSSGSGPNIVIASGLDFRQDFFQSGSQLRAFGRRSELYSRLRFDVGVPLRLLDQRLASRIDEHGDFSSSAYRLVRTSCRRSVGIRQRPFTSHHSFTDMKYDQSRRLRRIILPWEDRLHLLAEMVAAEDL